MKIRFFLISSWKLSSIKWDIYKSQVLIAFISVSKGRISMAFIFLEDSLDFFFYSAILANMNLTEFMIFMLFSKALSFTISIKCIINGWRTCSVGFSLYFGVVFEEVILKSLVRSSFNRFLSSVELNIEISLCILLIGEDASILLNGGD